MKKLILIPVLILMLLSACGTPIPVTNPTNPPENPATQQAMIEQAVRATATSIAMETLVATLQTPASQPQPGVTVIVVTSTPEPATAVPPTATLPPTATGVPPTATLPPTATSAAPTATPTQVASCNDIDFVSDITIPDGTTLAPGATFVKTWRLRNNGTCSWTTAYDLVFSGGTQMNAPAAVDMPATVAPGQSIDISITFVAPTAAGTYRSSWKMRDANGVLFGIGKNDVNFYTEIKVGTVTTSAPLDMAASYCSAEWSSGGTRLACPGATNDSKGYVVKVEKPVLESGYQDDEAALLVSPAVVNDSVIRGIYPVMRVESDYHFTAIIGCAFEASGCDVTFQLDYQIGSDPIVTLKSWGEKYEKQYNSVDVDLSSLAGKDVRFILTVHSNGATTNDRVLWLAPRIAKK